ncbi:MAG: sialidase family protein [Limisphaerales bacterium]
MKTLLVHCLCLALAGTLGVDRLAAESPQVEIIRTPDGGIQPQALIDAKGTVHLLYFKGKPAGGDLFYVRREPGRKNFSMPIRVNSQPGSAIATGTIRGGQIALGRRGRVHAAWNGGAGASAVKHAGAPMLYARLNDTGTAFEPERDVITDAIWLDGGGSVAADPRGNVYVVWHASPPGNKAGEAGRAVFVAHSSDDGRTFSREAQANPQPTGACGCCGLRAFADDSGTLYIVYRAATAGIERGETLLVSRDFGKSFALAALDQWRASTCPMSSVSLAGKPGGVLAAWERADQVYFSTIAAGAVNGSVPQAPAGTGPRKHPVAVGNATGETLVVWTEGTGWERGGSLAWQLFDPQGRPTRQSGRSDGVPVWGLASAVAQPDGRFLVFY